MIEIQKNLSTNGKNLEKYKCEFCEREFIREKVFLNHSCEKKRRWVVKDDASSRFGFLAWRRFYEFNKMNKSVEYLNNYQNFIESKFYNAFIKFGKHIVDINAMNPEKFIDFVIKLAIPIDKWTKDFVYEQYIRELIRRESPEDALKRNMEFMSLWSNESNEKWYDFFRKVTPSQAVYWIRIGKISPWLLYNAESAMEFLEKCTTEQLEMIKEVAPVGPWKIRFSKNNDACEFIRTTLKMNGM